MEATVRITCPKCKNSLRIPSQWIGQAVKCKKCGALVKSKPRTDGPVTDDTATNTALPPPAYAPAPPAPAAPQPVAPGNAFDFDKPSEHDENFFGQPHADTAPAPAPQSAPAYPYPAPGVSPAGAYPLPPGYPAPPPGYPAPPPGYPAPMPGYPYAAPPGYGPPPGYGYPAPPGYPMPAQHGYAPPPGYPYPQHPPAPAAPSPPPAAIAPSPAAPVAANNAFNMDHGDSADTPSKLHSKYRRRSNKGKFVWIGLCLLLTAGLVAGGIYGRKFLPVEKKPNETEVEKDTNTTPKQVNVGFPRRMLFISVTKYMYLNPLTAGQQGAPDRTLGAARGLAFQWHIPTKENDQLFVLSDTVMGKDERFPMKNVLEGAYQEFFRTSRGQDRIVVYFGGHAIERGGKSYLAPMEAELDGEDWEKTLIPLEHFYDELAKCKATQKVVIWDVCRYNPEKGKVRPGSEPMSEALFTALTSPPPGVQAITTCKANENALEFSQLRPDGFTGKVYSGSAFLESAKYIANSENSRGPKTTPTSADPFPIPEWYQAVTKRTEEMSAMAEKVGNGGKQTVTLVGSPPAPLVAPDTSEKIAMRFEMPHSPKGTSQAEIKAVESEFNLPALKPDLATITVADFPFPADVMKDYAQDVPLSDITKNKEKYPLRNAVLDTLNKLRERWASGAGTTNIRKEVEGPIDDALKGKVKSEQEFWAISIAELELELSRLEGMVPMRDAEPKRWQAHFDFAMASLKARLAYMHEYNKLLGNLVTDSLPALDAKLGQDGYTLVASETLKSGKDVKKMAEEAQTLFAEISVKYKGTPWAIQAKQEKAVAIGLNWKPASLKKEP